MAKIKEKDNTLRLNFDSARNLSPALESRSIAKIEKQYDLFINGKWEKPSSKKYFATILCTIKCDGKDIRFISSSYCLR